MWQYFWSLHFCMGIEKNIFGESGIQSLLLIFTYFLKLYYNRLLYIVPLLSLVLCRLHTLNTLKHFKVKWVGYCCLKSEVKTWSFPSFLTHFGLILSEENLPNCCWIAVLILKSEKLLISFCKTLRMDMFSLFFLWPACV